MRIALMGVATIPPITALVVLCRWGLNVPYWDDWDFVPALQAVAEGRLGWHDLWPGQNEHRIVITRALRLVLAAFTRWDLRAELVASFLLAGVTFALLMTLLRRTFQSARSSSLLYLIAVTSAFVFPVAGWENWLFGSNVQVYLGNAAAVLTLFVVSRLGRTWPGLLLSLLTTVAAVLCFGNGLALLPLLPAALALSPDRQGGPRRTTAVVVAGGLGAVVAAAYAFHHAMMPTPLTALQRPSPHVDYFMAVLGTPFWLWDVRTAMIIGAVGVVAFACALWSVARQWRELGETARPWLLVSLYGLLNAVMITLARARYFPTEQALTPRYVNFVGFFWLGLFVVAVLVTTRALPRVHPQAIGLAFLAVTALMWGLSVAHGLPHLQHEHRAVMEGSRCLRASSSPSDACIRLVYYDTSPDIRRRIQWLRDARLSLFAVPDGR